jgi:DNA-binding response OmpR family regulator
MVVADDPIPGRNIRTFLDQRGYRVERALTLADARKARAELHPVLILRDHNHPDGIGFRLTEETRAVDSGAEIVMIMALGGMNPAVTAM